ncbi:MAG: alpha/beta fold hydrolase, partial [bacterium]|nr:alpha/beta fold hydrolase [bacterium]
PLAHKLGSDQPLYGLQSRGLEGDEEPLTRIEEMAAHYLGELRAVQPRGPYQLTGWSFGGLVAYEMARQLAAAEEEVASLVLIDAGAPVAAEEPPDAAIYDDDALWLADVGNFVARLAGGEPPVSYEELRELARDEQVPTFVARMREVGFLPLGSGEGGLRRLLRVYKTNVVASRTYQPLPYDGP